MQASVQAVQAGNMDVFGDSIEDEIAGIQAFSAAAFESANELYLTTGILPSTEDILANILAAGGEFQMHNTTDCIEDGLQVKAQKPQEIEPEILQRYNAEKQVNGTRTEYVQYITFSQHQGPGRI